MAKLNFIKTLNKGEPGLIETLTRYTFGEKPVLEYNTTRTYEKGDIVRITSADGTFIVYQCNSKDPISGTFAPDKWISCNASMAIGAMSSNKNVAYVGTTAPPDQTTVLWFQTIKSKSAIDSSKLSGLILLMDGTQFAAQSTQPTDPENVVWAVTT